MQIKYLIYSVLLVLLCSCSKESKHNYNEPSTWITAKVAVILPLSESASNRARYERIAKMFEENVVKSQLNLEEGVKLELEWYDENSVDMKQLAYQLEEREDIKAVIGPLGNDNLEIVAKDLCTKGIPLFAFSTSEDIVRRYSCGTAGVWVKDPFLWSICETDITEIQLLLAKMYTMGLRSVSVISVNDKYGKTFNEWLPFHANEMKLELVDKVQYSNHSELQSQIEKLCKSSAKAIVCALKGAEDAKIVLQTVKNIPNAPKLFFTGSVLNSELLELGDLAEGAEGLSLYSSPNSGFHIAYQEYFGEFPMPREAQLYDAFLLSLVSFAYCHYSGKDIDMNQALVALSDLPLPGDPNMDQELHWGKGIPVWDYSGLGRVVLDLIRMGELPQANLLGASGNLKFADEAYTSLVQSTYINWLIYDGKPVALDYVAAKGVRVSSYLAAWSWQSSTEDLLDDYDEKIEFINYEGCKAVLICGSEGWDNYRHQADLLYVYQYLKKNGYSDDDIILIMRDDIADNPKNIYKNTIKISPVGENLYTDVKLDYRADTIGVDDIMNILLGNKSDRLTTVLESNETDNVLLYWTGHGKVGWFSWLETDEKFTDLQMGEFARQMYEQKRYMSMLICAEPCYSGSVVKAIKGVPRVLGISSADEYESSFADNYSNELGVWMCDRFTANFIKILDQNPYLSFKSHYDALRSVTLGSHVKIYNNELFYDLSMCGPWIFFEIF